jgi:dTDP-4-amino-4,6-dideoxygalactose transaminase
LAGEEQLRLPREAAGRTHVYHVYAVRVQGASAQRRDGIIDALAKRGVQCGIHYPIPVHLQEAYAHLGLATGSFPVAEQCAHEFISLPMFPELTHDQIETVARELKVALRAVAA